MEAAATSNLLPLRPMRLDFASRACRQCTARAPRSLHHHGRHHPPHLGHRITLPSPWPAIFFIYSSAVMILQLIKMYRDRPTHRDQRTREAAPRLAHQVLPQRHAGQALGVGAEPDAAAGGREGASEGLSEGGGLRLSLRGPGGGQGLDPFLQGGREGSGARSLPSSHWLMLSTVRNSNLPSSTPQTARRQPPPRMGARAVRARTGTLRPSLPG
jgi:hypothetical protein